MIEVYAPEGSAHRKMVLLEMVHEEMEVRIKAGECFEVDSYLSRFADLAADPNAVLELVEAESALRRRVLAAAGATSIDRAEQTDLSSRPPARIGRYELQDVIGQGAFGVIYRAWDPELDRAVALKRPRCGVLDEPGAVERFLRETRSTATLRHPRIVPVFDAGQFKGVPYLVSALVDGRNLAHELADRRPGFRQAAEWVAALADALQHAHEQGIVHRDVKPSNVLIDNEGQVYLTDFGLAKSNAFEATLTIDGQMLGTPAYMAPEQTVESNEPVDARTDVYSLGVVLYELLTGARPFQGSERMLLLRIQEEEPTPPRRLDDAVPRDLETICIKAMAKAPGHRYQDAASLAAELRRYLRGEPVRARPLGPIRAFWRKCRRKPVVSGLATSLVLAVVLGFAGVTWQWRRAERQRHQALHALSSGFSILSSAMELGSRDPNHPDSRRQREVFLDSLRNSLQDQSRTYPELNATLKSVTMGALKLLYQTAPRTEALSAHEKIRISFEGLARDDPHDLSFRDALARCLIGEGTMLLQMGRLKEGEARVRESLEQRQLYIALAADRPEAGPVRLSVREAWLAAELDLASVEIGLGRTPDAITCRQRALVLAEELVRERPDSTPAVHRLANIHWEFANLVRDDRPGEAISSYRRAAELIEPIALAGPSESAIWESLASYVFWLAVTEDRENRVQAASVDFHRARVICEKTVRARPLDPDFRCLLSTCYHVLGRLQFDSGHPLESLDLYRGAIAHREELCRLEPLSLRWRGDCAGSWHRLGEALENLGRINEAVDAYQKSLLHERQVYVLEPRDIQRGKSLDERLRQVLSLQRALGRPAEAVMVARQRKGSELPAFLERARGVR
jgi:serine/threonine protein kinase